MYRKIMEGKNKNRRSKNRSKRRSQNNNRNYTKYNYSKDDLEKIKSKLHPDIDYTMDGSVKQLFLNLTKMQIVFDKEHTLEPLLPDSLDKDEHENYYIKIGDSKTMFCAHLDTYSHQYKRVYHIIDGDIIKTDGTTTLGGDDKAGVVIMIKMIEAGIPGLYYFFRGEEGVTSPTGTWGSRQALKSYKDMFKDYEKCIAFDRKGFTSIISSQMYSECCSPEFVKALKAEFVDNGLDYKDDDTGMWCDSGVFMETIPECTNISVGYKNEHTFSETQDIAHLETLVEACISINWDALPVVRDPYAAPIHTGGYFYDLDDFDYGSRSTRSSYYDDLEYRSGRNIAGKREYITMEDLFSHVVNILDDLKYECINPNVFEEAEEMYFMNYDTNDFFGLRIVDFDIYISDDELLKTYSLIGDLDLFEEYLIGGVEQLDVEASRHLDSIANEAKPDKKYSFTKTQESVFKEFLNHYPSLAYDIIQFCGSKPKRLSTELYQIVNFEMEEYGFFSGLDTDPFDYTDWLYDNNELVNKVLKRKSDNKEPKEVFMDLTEKNPDFIRKIKVEMDKEKSPIVPSSLWIKIEKLIIDSGYKPTYNEKGGINADDFVEWIYDYPNLVNKILRNKKPKINNIKQHHEAIFINTIDELKNNTNQYNKNENVLFSEIVDREKTLVKLILADIDIQGKPKVRDTTSDKIIDLFDKKHDVGDPTYAELEFIHWLNDYKKEIKEYYS